MEHLIFIAQHKKAANHLIWNITSFFLNSDLNILKIGCRVNFSLCCLLSLFYFTLIFPDIFLMFIVICSTFLQFSHFFWPAHDIKDTVENTCSHMHRIYRLTRPSYRIHSNLSRGLVNSTFRSHRLG